MERGRNRSRSMRFPILDNLTVSGDIGDRTVKVSEIAPNFACFWPPEFLDLHYKAARDCDHMAKFHGDRPRDLRGSLAKQVKKHHGKI